MKTEIERKFLVRPEALPREALGAGAKIAQGYLSHDPTVRVRLKETEGEPARGYLTIKGKGTISRDEFEYDIPAEDARALLGMCQATLTKMRHTLPAGARAWEIDEFTGPHAGLWLAEIELGAEDEAFARPAWLGAEVSDDPRYTNGALARAGRAP